MKVIAVKFPQGDEIIGRLAEETETSITLESPRAIGIQESQNGVGLGFMPWLLSNPEATVVIDRSQIAAVFEPRADIEKAYIQQTSRIQLMG
jgi:hypothetical protein